MQKTVVLRSIGSGLLTAAACVWAWSAVHAEQPLVQFTGQDQGGQATVYVPLANPSGVLLESQFAPENQSAERPSMLIPTDWDRNPQLIPTEFEARTLTVTRKGNGNYAPIPARDADPIKVFLRKQLQLQTPATVPARLPADRKPASASKFSRSHQDSARNFRR